MSKHDDTVWKIATKIYSESGHKVEFSLVRDIVNSHIEVLKMHVATEKAAAYKRLQCQKVEEAREWHKKLNKRQRRRIAGKID